MPSSTLINGHSMLNMSFLRKNMSFLWFVYALPMLYIMRFQGKDVRGKSSKHLYFVRSTFIRKSWELTFISETIWGQVRRSLQKYFLKYSVDHPLEGAILTEAIHRMFRSLPLPPLICSPNTQLAKRDGLHPRAWGQSFNRMGFSWLLCCFQRSTTTHSQVFGAPKAKPIQVGFLLECIPLTLQSTLSQKVCEQLHFFRKMKSSIACRQVSRNM